MPPMRAITVGSLLVFLALSLSLSGCGQPVGGDGASPPAGPSRTRPASKVTCPVLEWHPPAALQMSETHRDLIPLTAEVLGTKTSFTGPGGVSAQTVSGGSGNDHLRETYGDLEVVGHQEVADGQLTAPVMRGSFRGVPVDLVTWRDSRADPPCDVRSLLITGADRKSARALIAGLR
jgi:hypothetical protein